jgi:viroplasmin and RNaseH domain-containing protein
MEHLEQMHPDDRELLCRQYCDFVGADFEDFESLEEAENWLNQNIPWITEYQNQNAIAPTLES